MFMLNIINGTPFYSDLKLFVFGQCDSPDVLFLAKIYRNICHVGGAKGNMNPVDM